MFEGVEGIEYCHYNQSYDTCTGEDLFCNATVMTTDGIWHNDTCSYLEEYFNLPDQCGEVISEVSCMEDVEGIEGVESCNVIYGYDTCNETQTSCWIDAYVYGELISGECDAVMAQFGNQTCDPISMSGDCLDEETLEEIDGITYCNYQSTYYPCEDHEECFVNVVVNGVEDSGDCHEVRHKWSSNQSCEEADGGDCMYMFEGIEGIEYCHYNSSFDSCTQEDLFCNATVKTTEGIWYNDTCQALEEYFSL